MKSPKRVLIITSSPRKNGNSTILALKAAEGVKAAGGVADIAAIGNLKIAPCNACDACRAKPDAGCVIKDDMQPIYQKIEDAEGIIFATPIYWFNVSAQMKLLIDRTYATHRESGYAFTGKDVGVILTYEDEDVYVSGGVNALHSFKDIFAYVKANLVGTVYGSANKAGEVQGNEKLLEKAYNLGRKIAQTK
ncbi:flavodoxin family protein [Candidatus Bathyarchaeota archaeon]|jgi:multimeric flavodoxin WrbA|nr:MAG: flavodoxin family protein [Candidatus Bathyarchaeota archaeon]